MPKVLSTEQFIEKAKRIHGNKYSYSEVIYKNSHTPIKIYCKRCKEYFYQIPNNHLTGMQCKKCAIKLVHNKQKYTIKQFIEKANKIHNNKYDYSKSKYISYTIPLEIICKRCGKTFLQTPVAHLRGHGCKNCNDKNKCIDWKARLTLLNKLGITKYLDFSKAKYVHSKQKIEVICKKCGLHFFTLLGNIMAGKGCPRCKASKGENQIEAFLIKNQIKFIRQHKFDDCKDKRKLLFDFYLPNHNMCIEYQGGQHYEKFRFEKNDINLQKRMHRDQIKRSYCKLKNIKLLEIKYNEDIERVLKNNLVEK